ncbi:MAG: DUF1697 domain-containing protein [Thermoplasmata archaeon]|nr:DUF1697 domain-containing protein [Thermoplasmata archaeon]
MTTFIALLRAVNLGGSTQVSMTGLKDLLDGEGFDKVRTLLNSGNLVFQTGRGKSEELEHRLETLIARRFGRSTDVFVRSASEWHEVLAQNPFELEAEKDPGHLQLTSLKAAPSAESWAGLRSAIQGRERFVGHGRHAYIVYPDGVGRSKLTAALIERKLGTRSTSRNWNTARKLDGLAAG